MNLKLEGKVALVTGASRGIGAAIARQLAEQGATVVGTATTEEGASRIADALGTGHHGRRLQLNESGAAEALVKEVSSEIGAPTILVNNAGITRDQLLLRMSEDDWDAIMQTNLKSVFVLSKACMRAMLKARWGRIISIASVVGVTGNPGQANYAAAKAGIIAFSKSLAREVGSRGVTANVVAPGFIDTDMTRDLSDDQRQALLTDVPLDRLGAPEDIASAVGFLASDAAAYITGETLHVNGGMHMA